MYGGFAYGEIEYGGSDRVVVVGPVRWERALQTVFLLEAAQAVGVLEPVIRTTLVEPVQTVTVAESIQVEED